MKAFVANSYGGPEVMCLSEVPDPVARGGQVVVTVRASSVNPIDWKKRKGDFRLLTGKKFPKVFGCDFAGVIRTVSPGVTSFTVGDAVYGVVSVMSGGPGAHAEQVAVTAKGLRRLPAGLSFERAAALPIAGLTALNGLRQCGELDGKTVLVNGASGGVGHFAVQIARARGARVTAVSRTLNIERTRELGAEHVLDYGAVDFTQAAERYNVVFDAFGQVGFAGARRVLEPHGCYVTTLGNPVQIPQAVWQQVMGRRRLVFANLRTKPEDYEVLEKYVTEGQVIPVVERVFPLNQAADAFAAQEGGGTVGKVVIRMD